MGYTDVTKFSPISFCVFFLPVVFQLNLGLCLTHYCRYQSDFRKGNSPLISLDPVNFLQKSIHWKGPFYENLILCFSHSAVFSLPTKPEHGQKSKLLREKALNNPNQLRMVQNNNSTVLFLSFSWVLLLAWSWIGAEKVPLTFFTCLEKIVRRIETT